MPTPTDAMIATANALGAPLLLAAGAVCLGFLAFLPTAYVGVAELGVIAGIGMIIALALSASRCCRRCSCCCARGRPAAELGDPALRAGRRLPDPPATAVLWACSRVSMVASVASLPLRAFRLQPAAPAQPAGRGDGDARRSDARSRSRPQHDRHPDPQCCRRAGAGGAARQAAARSATPSPPRASCPTTSRPSWR